MTRITFIAVLGLVASCSADESTGPSSATPPADRPATYGAPRSLGGPLHQWSLLVTVDALKPEYSSWFNQSCTNDIEELSKRQTLFARRLDDALASILIRNSHCAVSTIAPLAYGTKGCGNSDTSNPSGAYVVFSCSNSEPMNTTAQAPPAPLP